MVPVPAGFGQLYILRFMAELLTFLAEFFKGPMDREGERVNHISWSIFVMNHQRIIIQLVNFHKYCDIYLIWEPMTETTSQTLTEPRVVVFLSTGLMLSSWYIQRREIYTELYVSETIYCTILYIIRRVISMQWIILGPDDFTIAGVQQLPQA